MDARARRGQSQSLRDAARLDPEFQQRLLRARVQRVEGRRVAGAPDEDEDGSEGEKGG